LGFPVRQPHRRYGGLLAPPTRAAFCSRSALTPELWRIRVTAVHPHDVADFTLFPLLVLVEAAAVNVHGRVSVPLRETPNGEAVGLGARGTGSAPRTPANLRGSGQDALPPLPSTACSLDLCF